jgi:hypothetical protein
MANIIVELTREMRRVRELLPQFDAQQLHQVQRTLHYASVSIATNSYEGMQESLDDLREITAEKKQ